MSLSFHGVRFIEPIDLYLDRAQQTKRSVSVPEGIMLASTVRDFASGALSITGVRNKWRPYKPEGKLEASN